MARDISWLLYSTPREYPDVRSEVSRWATEVIGPYLWQFDAS